MHDVRVLASCESTVRARMVSRTFATMAAGKSVRARTHRKIETA